LGVVTHAYNPSIWKAEQEDYELKASLGYVSQENKTQMM
jgi:hypothetical protein